MPARTPAPHDTRSVQTRRPSSSKAKRLAKAALLVGVLAGITLTLVERKKARRARAARHAARQEVYQPSVPLTPDEERKSFTIAPGFRAELVASEPLIKDPVALAFGPDGRVWVCEMQGYMPDANGTDEGGPLGRVVILEDTDGDGRMDKSTVFLDKLVLPRAISLAGNGVLVAEPPRLWFCPDRDGDGKADEKIEVDPQYALASVANPEHMSNGLVWGMDNWIYNAKSYTRYRLNPDGGFERATAQFRGQWGLTQDDGGRFYYNTNRYHLQADVVQSGSYLRRNRNFPAARGINFIIAGNEKVFPSHPTPGISAGADELHQGKLKRFTSACGPAIYRGELFPAEFRGNAFVCEPAGNLIRRDIVTIHGGIPKAENAHDGAEFLASSDERFRPVNLYTGPDGALWVVDMYRGVIEHKNYMSKPLRKYLRGRNLDQPVGMGRIWRIVPENAPVGSLPKLTSTSTAELVARLEHPNGWWRDTAQRLLVEKRDNAAVPSLGDLLRTSKSAAVRLHALWTLEGMGALTVTEVETALADAEPRIRAAGIRLAERFLTGNAPLRERLLGMVKDPSPEARLQLALTCGEMDGPEKDKAMLTMLALVSAEEGNLFLQDAVMTGLEGEELKFLALYLASLREGDLSEMSRLFVQKLTGAILNERDHAHCQQLVEFIARQTSPGLQAFLIDSFADVPQTALNGFRPINLEHEPEGWTALAAHVDEVKLARMADSFSWPGKPSVLEPTVIPLTESQRQRFTQGKELFAQICAACHQPDGRGQEGLAPPLVNSEWTLGNEQRLVRIVLHGLAGKIVVAGRTYNMEMPGFEALTDEQIASILTYIRREWAHVAAPVETTTVTSIRAVGARQEPWSTHALLKFK